MKNNNNNNLQNNNMNTDDLEKTNKIDLVFDDDRLEKTELLDFSFIDENSEVKEDSIVNNNLETIEVLEDALENKKPGSNKTSILALCLLGVCAFVLGFGISFLFSDSFKEVKIETVTKVETKTIVDENIVFLGDSIFAMYDVNEYFKDNKVINSGISGHKTTDVLKDMQYRVYRYNPSVVFMMIGTNDVLDSNLTNEDTVENIGKIVDEIKTNRPYAVINVISIFPVNRSSNDKIKLSMVGERSNEDIKKMNDEIEKMCKEKKVTYIDMYSLLADEEDNLSIDYTVEGLHINDEGYEVITEELMKYIEKK